MRRKTIRKVTTPAIQNNSKEEHFPRVTLRPNNPNKVTARTFNRIKNPTPAKPIKFATEITKANKEVCFVLGSGPSLTGFDFNQLSGFDTIAVNKAVEYLHNPTYFITTDYTYFLKASLPIEKINAKTHHSYCNKII